MRALAMATGKLIDAKEKSGRERIEACYTNRRLWNIFLADLMLPENGLPGELKAQLISLAIWVQKYSGGAMRGTDPLDPLIDVNKQILEGLSQQGKAGAHAPAAPDAREGAAEKAGAGPLRNAAGGLSA